MIVTKTGKHLKVSPTSYFLLASFNKGIRPEQIAETLNVSVEKVNSSYESLTKKINELDENQSHRRTGFWFLWEIIPGSLVEKIARPFSLMFHPFIVLPACALIFTSIFLNIQIGAFADLFSSLRNPETFWIGYLLFLLSIVVHEFGHAAASVRYGAAPSGIGFTLYLIFPALYSDVTTSWKLKSGQRAIVGLGGIYFQLIAAAVYTLLGIFLETAAFEIAALMIFGNCLLNLNPFFKFDGYWILSDLLGVVNLHRQPKQIFLYLYNRLRGREVASLPWLAWISLFIGIYSIGSIFIIGFFVWRYSSRFWSVIQKYPAAFQLFFDKVFSRESV
ncbi:MAG TPA: hypothetical protein VF599_23835, partial [Pyrinomonadaceae bacterium]